MGRGNISIHTENIFPIIKKWLYSDKDIFVRELISNGCDAVHKLKRLVSLGEAKIEEDNDYKIVVKVNKDKKTLSFSDNGIGMTAEEVEKYITQVAFSGAEDFVKQYKESEDEGKQIIGHFGLGFYSAFMVSDKVQIDTLSYKDGSNAVKWVCDGGTEYEIGESKEQTSRGTTITLYINEESSEFLDNYKVRSVIEKYCSFMPVEIFFEDECAEKKDEEKETPINEIKPLWTKMPKDCSDEEYKEFYKKEFKDYNDPLFWIHLNVDYPFNLKGILYFPKLKHELEVTEGEVKLYNNQVYVADNIKEVIPEFLLLLKGVIDCPDLPLNVSRSFLQQDKNVIKISKHIVKKVSDKLVNVFTNQRENYESFWDDIQIFIKYGCLRDESFYENRKIENPETGTEILEGRNILIAEDNDLNAEIAEAILKRAGLKTERVVNGIQCVNMITKMPADTYDMILMDIQMPEMDGYEAARAIRQLPDREKACIPIIAMTANAFEEDKKDAMAAGMNGHMAKPIQVEQLLSMLAEMMCKK